MAAADSDPEKLDGMRRLTGIGADACYDVVEAMLKQQKLADVMLICMPDRCPCAQAKTALLKDYDLLLEMPTSINAAECTELSDIALERGRKAAVCHALRYTAFYQKIKEILDSGMIGDTVNDQAGGLLASGPFLRARQLAQCRAFVGDDPAKVLTRYGHPAVADGQALREGLRLFRADQAPAGSTVSCVAVPTTPWRSIWICTAVAAMNSPRTWLPLSREGGKTLRRIFEMGIQGVPTPWRVQGSALPELEAEHTASIAPPSRAGRTQPLRFARCQRHYELRTQM